jgi:hypothetical protein
MTIPQKRADAILKRIKLRYAGTTINPSINSDYELVDIYSNELPIRKKSEFEIAKEIGRKYNLELEWIDFSPGEGLGKGVEPRYELVYRMSCRSLNDLKEAPKQITRAVCELKKELENIIK